MSLLDARRYLDPMRWQELARCSEDEWLLAWRTESPTERFCAAERWDLSPRPRTEEEELLDRATHARVAGVLARVRPG